MDDVSVYRRRVTTYSPSGVHAGSLYRVAGSSVSARTRPPSPDGRTLAVARRAGAATVLDLLDLESGALRRVGDWLDPDEQEGFAINGLHPRMDWFDDGRHLLVSAGGQLWKVDTATGDRVAIPFTAKVEARIQPAVRPRRPAVQDEVRARLIRWPTVSPDGSTLAFGALGSIWRMDLPDGTPARLTRDDVREFGPTLSPDGRTIAYVAFDDEEGGSVRTVSARGGRSKTIGAVGPKYVNPHFSPDGRELVLLRGSGSHERGGSLAWDVWTDVITMDVKTGETEIVTQTSGGKRGAQPRFSPDGARILIPEDRPVDKDAAKGALVSVNRDGTDKRDLISAGNATDIVLSPDGRWAAWTEAHHVWIARLPPLGRQTFALDKNGGSVPTWRLTESTGDWVDFPWGSGAVTWNDGVEVRRMELDALVAWEEERQEQARIEAEAAAAEDQDENEDENENEDEDEDENENEKENENEDDDEDENEDEEDAVPPSDAFTVDLRVPRLVPTGSFAITGATVLTMNGDEVLTGHTVVVRDDRIASVAPDGTVELGPDVHLVDGAGLTVIPGLVDVHAHGHFSANDVMDTEHWPYWANLAYGVTTLHDPSAFSDQVFTYAEMVEAGLMTGPRVFSTGMILYGAAGAWSSHVETAEDALRHVRRMKALGAISVKSYQQPRRDQRQWIVDACRAEGLLDIPEGGGDTWGNLTMVLDGHSAIEHAMPTVPLQEDVVRFFAASDTYYTPTLTVAYGGPSGEFFFYGEGPVWADERLQRFVPAANLAKGRRPAVQITDPAEWRHIRVAQSAAAIARAGGHVTVGGHGQMQGLGTHWEMWALAGEGAMTAAEALRAATIEGARYLGMEDDLGTVEAGKLADLVVLGSDPLEDIRSSADVRYVVRGGELYDAWTMDRLWPEPAPKPTLRWERARDALTGPVLSE